MRRDMVCPFHPSTHQPFHLSALPYPSSHATQPVTHANNPSGYANFFTNTTTYTPYLGTAPASWSLVPAVRHALTLHPQTPWFFSLSPHSLIMNPSLSLQNHVLNPSTLSTLMLRDIPIVPPDSVIHTFSHLSPSKVDLILTQDAENLSPSSFLLRRGEWAKYFLDSWMDTLYRTYNFQKAEGHALEHLTQWHPTILSHLALLPQRYLNAYNFEAALMGQASSTTDPTAPAPEIKQSVIKENGPSLYSEGDFLVRFQGCDTQGGQGMQVGPGGVVNSKDGKGGSRSCEKELEGYWGRWRKEVARIDGELGKGA